MTCQIGGVVVADSLCASAGSKPPTQQSCNTGPCTGACCTGAACSVVSASACASAGGSFRGDLSVCNAPGNNTTPCCKADFDQSGTRTVDDIFIYLNRWFTLDIRCDVNASSSVDIDDIFIFINLWFAGC